MKIRPLPGFLWATKYTHGVNQRLKIKEGVFEGSMHSSGLFIPNTRKTAENDVLAKTYRIESVGEDGGDSEGWPTKWFLPTKEDQKVRTRKWNRTFADEGIEPGVLVAASAKAGLRNELQHQEVQLRHDEIVAIGKPLDAKYDKDEFPMFAAPGWVIIKLDMAGDKTKGGLTIDARINTRLEQGTAQWGRIVELPRGTSYDDLGQISVGLSVAVPYALHAGDYALEWVDFEGGFRAVPLMCLLAVAYEPDPEDDSVDQCIPDARVRGFEDGLGAGINNGYMNPYVPNSPAWHAYDVEYTEGACK